MPKIQITFDSKLLDKISFRADQLGLSKSGWVNMACSEKLNSDDILSLLPDMLKKISALEKLEKDKKNK